MPKSRSEVNKTYYENHYDKIKEYLTKKRLCLDCDCEVLYCHFSRHIKTKKHTKSIQKNYLGGFPKN